MRPRPTLLLLAALASGCTAAKAEVNIVQASQALQSARQADADKQATYEFTLATRYLRKAQEENGYSDYKTASLLARQSESYANQAVSVTERARKLKQKDAGSDLSDQTKDPTAPTPKPAPPPPSTTSSPDDDLDEPDSPPPKTPPTKPAKPPAPSSPAMPWDPPTPGGALDDPQ